MLIILILNIKITNIYGYKFILILTLKGMDPSGIESVVSLITIKGVSDGREALVAANVVDAIEADVITTFALVLSNCFDISSENFHHVCL